MLNINMASLRSFTEVEIDGVEDEENKPTDYSDGGDSTEKDTDVVDNEDPTDYSSENDEDEENNASDDNNDSGDSVDTQPEEPEDYSSGDNTGDESSDEKDSLDYSSDNNQEEDNQEEDNSDGNDAADNADGGIDAELVGDENTQAERSLELKSRYQDLYKNIDEILSRLGDINKKADTERYLEKVNDQINSLKQYVLDYILYVFGNKSYTENEIQYQRYLAVLNTIKTALDMISNDYEPNLPVSENTTIHSLLDIFLS